MGRKKALHIANGLKMMKAVYEVGGKGHSCGIYSFNQDHIHQLALAAPVSRIMVRQSKANAGALKIGEQCCTIALPKAAQIDSFTRTYRETARTLIACLHLGTRGHGDTDESTK
jgi:hypothetical protein